MPNFELCPVAVTLISFWLTMMRFLSCFASPTGPVMGFFPGNLITECTVVVSDGTFNQKGNQKVFYLWVFLQESSAKLSGVASHSQSALPWSLRWPQQCHDPCSRHLPWLPALGCTQKLAQLPVPFLFKLVLDLPWQLRTAWHPEQVMSKSVFGFSCIELQKYVLFHWNLQDISFPTFRGLHCLDQCFDKSFRFNYSKAFLFYCSVT